MITLYHRPKTRSSRFIFLLEELGAPYEIKIVTTRSRDGTGAVDPANPHPHGKVPAISDDGVVVFERLADHDPEGCPAKIAEARRKRFERRDHYTVDLRTLRCSCKAADGCKHKSAVERLVAEGLLQNTNEG